MCQSHQTSNVSDKMFFNLQGARIPPSIPQPTDVLNGVSNLDMRKFEPFLMEDVDQEGIVAKQISISITCSVARKLVGSKIVGSKLADQSS